MNFFEVGNNIFNVNTVVQIQKIAANNYTIFLSDGRTFPLLTLSQVQPLFTVIGIDI